MTARAVVVGAGIVGLCCARSLLRDGHAVTVVDRSPEGDKASFGNAGGIAVTEITPASAPGLIFRVPGWLLDPLGPLALHPTHLPRFLPWLVRFMRSGSAAEIARLSAALAALTAPAAADIRGLLAELDLTGDLSEAGALWLYETRAAFAGDAADRALRRRYGIVMEELDGREARAMEPALGAAVCAAVFTPQWAHLADPKRLVDRLRGRLAVEGVTFTAADALAVEGGTLRLAGGPALAFDRLVVAAGAWSGALARSVGDRVLLEGERGYNVTLPTPGIAVSRELIFAEHKFVATPMDMGLRIGGMAEFAALDAPATIRRSQGFVTRARRYLPDLVADGGTPWMGLRPSTPDSLPVLGPSPRRPDVLYSILHGHGGLTLAPTTGRIIADLIAGRPAVIDTAPFSISRF